MKNNPIIISGLGGSGTRVIVSILKEMDFNFGYDVNKADDDLSFTLLFKHPRHFTKYFNKKSSYISRLLDIHNKLLLNKKLNFIDFLIILKLVINHMLFIRRYNLLWGYKRLKNILTERKYPNSFWGWKEPHCITFLPDLYFKYPKAKFILLIRNGLDMVFSENDQQFYNYAHYFGLNKKDDTPKNKFEFWYRFNKYSIEQGTKLFGDSFLITYYEDLSRSDENDFALKELIGFLDQSTSVKKDSKGESKFINPGTINRYQKYDTSWIDENVLAKMKEIGYSNFLKEQKLK